MTRQPAPVPLFASIRHRDGGRFRHCLLTGSESESEQGPVFCRVLAPNGATAEGELTKLDYAGVRDLFAEEDIRNLLVDPGAMNVDRPPAYDRVGLCAWGHGQPIGRDRWRLEAALGLDGIEGVSINSEAGSEIEQIQLWAESGPATVMAVPAGATLCPVPGSAEFERRIRTIVVGPDVLCTAYWGFYRHASDRAAAAIGERLVRSIADGEQESSDALPVAAHACLHLLRETGCAERLAQSLRDAGGSDAAVMLWALELDGKLTCAPERRRLDFLTAASRLAAEGCLYTETLRTFVERSHEGRVEVTDEDARDRVDKALAWIRSLALATYWDSEHLTYRAADPRSPDPTATDAQLAAATKKKYSRYQPASNRH